MAGPKYAAGKYSIAECDRCGQRYLLKQLKKLTIKTKQVSIKVCPECWEPDHPQLQLGMYPVYDPQAMREPRPDTSYVLSGTNGLQTTLSGGTGANAVGFPAEGSRIIEWGWNPIGGASGFDTALTPNTLIGVGQVGQVTVS